MHELDEPKDSINADTSFKSSVMDKEAYYKDLIIEQKNILIEELQDKINILKKHISLLEEYGTSSTINEVKHGVRKYVNTDDHLIGSNVENESVVEAVVVPGSTADNVNIVIDSAPPVINKRQLSPHSSSSGKESPNTNEFQTVRHRKNPDRKGITRMTKTKAERPIATSDASDVNNKEQF